MAAAPADQQGTVPRPRPARRAKPRRRGSFHQIPARRIDWGRRRERGRFRIGYSDLELLARLVKCEAGGEGEDGMKAVASVVMNRVRIEYGEYGRLEPTVRAVVFQKGQFVCAMETVGGRYNPQNLYNMSLSQIHWEIAEWAMAGHRLTGLGQALWFFNPFSPSCRPNFPSAVGAFAVRIGGHCFYNPTAAYAQT